MVRHAADESLQQIEDPYRRPQFPTYQLIATGDRFFPAQLPQRHAGTITVRVLDQPAQVILWQAHNRKARDFRLETIGPAWTFAPPASTLPRVGAPTYPGDTPLVFTTEVVVTPDG